MQLMPEFPESMEWINLDRSPSVQDFQGKAVLLYFWSASNLYCEQLHQEIRILENEFEDQLYIIGVHCPRHPFESRTDSLKKIINQTHVRHFVVNDPEFEYWRKFGVEDYPTLVVVDVEGQVRGFRTGTSWNQEISEFVGEILEEAALNDLINYETILPTKHVEPESVLHFPSDVLQYKDKLYVADTGNNRVLEANLDGNVQRQFGSGNPGHWDGHNQEVGFASPKSLAILNDYLYVADTGNHAIRRIHLLSGEVDTIAGTGKVGQLAQLQFDKPTKVELNYPTGIASDNNCLYICMTGVHQIWMLDLNDNTLKHYAGSGRQGSENGKVEDASFFSPRHLCVVEDELLISDSENSLIRKIHLGKKVVSTLCGTTPGQKTGHFEQAAIRYPQGLAYDAENKILWLADSFNQNLKSLEIPEKHLDILPGQPAWQFPKGISICGNVLWATDVFMHALVKMDLNTLDSEIIHLHELTDMSQDYL